MKDHYYLDKQRAPAEGEIQKNLGNTADLWEEIHGYMKAHYPFTPELKFFTKKYGWMIRYRRSGKTLCSFFPKVDSFSVLLILGGKEAREVEGLRGKLTPRVLEVFDQTEQFHDGRWLWIEIDSPQELESFKLLLSLKRRPG